MILCINNDVMKYFSLLQNRTVNSLTSTFLYLGSLWGNFQDLLVVVFVHSQSRPTPELGFVYHRIPKPTIEEHF